MSAGPRSAAGWWGAPCRACRIRTDTAESDPRSVLSTAEGWLFHGTSPPHGGSFRASSVKRFVRPEESGKSRRRGGRGQGVSKRGDLTRCQGSAPAPTERHYFLPIS